METIITIIRSCAQDMHDVRARLPNNLDPGVIVLFDSVVRRLERIESIAGDEASVASLIDDGLQLAGRFCEVALAAAELLKLYRG